MAFLTAERIAFGVDRLLALMADREAVERHRPPPPPEGTLHVATIDAQQFPDRTAFHLTICSRSAKSSEPRSIDPAIKQLVEMIGSPSPKQAIKANDLGIEMIWLSSEPLILWQGVPSPKVETSLNACTPWILRVCVCEGCSRWIAGGSDPELRMVRSILDRYARPRLILPERDPARYREDFIALIAMFAAKAQCIGPRDDELPRFLRGYCDRFFSYERKSRKLSEADWYGVIDRVYGRLYRGEQGMGFTMPVFPGSFRAYIRQAVRGEAANAAPARRPIRKKTSFPGSINEAADRLDVSHMTVRRWMTRLHLSGWTEEAWLAISRETMTKKQWEGLTAELRASGLGAEAARKRVQRCKIKGRTPDEARRQTSTPQRRGTCTACCEEPVLGAFYRGSFLCGDCLREKKGISIW